MLCVRAAAGRGRLRRFVGATLAGLVLLVFGIPALAADVAVPPFRQLVTDLTGTLSPETESRLEQTLRQYEVRKGSQVAVLMVPTTQPEAIEQYSIRVVDSWKPGRKSVDDGVLLLVAKDDHAVRIEVGRGLEGVLPDITAHRIIEEDIVPRFKAGDFDGGVEAGITRVLSVIDGEPLPPPPAQRTRARGSGFEQYLVPGLIAIFVLGGIARTLFGRAIGAGLMGVLAAAVAWLISGALLVALIAGIIAFISVLLGGFGGGFGSGGGGFGGGGGGGFSGGGGGGFSGGGASGRW